MGVRITRQIVLTIFSHLFAVLTAVAMLASEPTFQPIREVTTPLNAERIELFGFEFQRPGLFEVSAHYTEIEEDPSVGVEYGVRAYIAGEEAIATAIFAAVDENGTEVQRISIVAQSNGVGASHEFIGLMTVPAQPFRIVLTGETVDGQEFRRVFRRLFRPVDRPDAGWSLPPDFPREEKQAFQQMYDTLAPAAIAERRALVAAANPNGTITMPRTRVSHVEYAPLLSAAGRPIGLRVAYDIEFSQKGRYNPEVRVFAEHKGDTITGLNNLRPLRSTIDPLPHEYYAPEKEREDIPGLLAQGTDLLNEAGTRYRFTADLVPSYVSLERDKSTRCLSLGFEYDPPKALARVLAHQGSTTYRVTIGFTMFEGSIESFHDEGALYQNFQTEGVVDCKR
jgi:hypothetical protein